MRWRKRNDDDLFSDGQVLLVATCSRGSHSFDIVTIRCDEDFSAIECINGDSWDGDISDIDYYSDIRDVDNDLRVFMSLQPKAVEND